MATPDSDNRSPDRAGNFRVDPQAIRSAAARLDHATHLLHEIGHHLASVNPAAPAYDAVSINAGQRIQAIVADLRAAVNSAEQRADDLANGVRLFVTSHEHNDQDVGASLYERDE